MGVESIFKALLFDCTFSSVVLNCIKSISEGKIVKSRDGKFLDNFQRSEKGVEFQRILPGKENEDGKVELSIELEISDI